MAVFSVQFWLRPVSRTRLSGKTEDSHGGTEGTGEAARFAPCDVWLVTCDELGGKAKETGARGQGAERRPEVEDWIRVAEATNGPKDQKTKRREACFRLHAPCSQLLKLTNLQT